MMTKNQLGYSAVNRLFVANHRRSSSQKVPVSFNVKGFREVNVFLFGVLPFSLCCT